MNIEYEIRILEIDKEKLIKKLEELGAKLNGKWYQKRYVYNTIPKNENEWIRLRTNGEFTTLAYKNVEKKSLDGTKELEVKVEDFENTAQILERAGLHHKGYQENKREQYILNGVEIDIDSWPLIPTYVEIEGKGEKEVLDIVELLELDKSKLTALDVQSVYLEVYGIDIGKISKLKFEEE